MATPSFQLFKYMTNILFLVHASFLVSTYIYSYSLQHLIKENIYNCILLQNGPDIYKMHNFSSVIVEKSIGVDTKKDVDIKKDLSGGDIAGIIISLLLVLTAVVVMAV